MFTQHKSPVRGVLYFSLVLFICSPKLAAQERSFSDSAKGFDHQFRLVVEAIKKGGGEPLKAELESFAIPGPWFAEVFGPEDGQELASLYADQFEDFVRHIPQSFHLAEQQYHVSVRDLSVETSSAKKAEPNPAPKAPPASLLPLPPIERFKIQTGYWARGKFQEAVSWMDSFVYLDGRFRFLGRGAYPFWDAANVRRADPCAKPGEQTGGKLISRVEPVYPEDAKEKRVKGIVRARLSIAKDGTVTAVEIIAGSPLLAEAAKQAMIQWRYTPFMNCGQPVEMRSIEHVKFTLP